jgi:hypothetical protein
MINGELTRVTREAEDALINAGVPIYSRGGDLVHPVTEECASFRNRKTRVARLAGYTPESLTYDLADSARFIAYNKKGEAFDVDPLLSIAMYLLANDHHWRVPRVAGVITSPLLRLEGALLDGQKAHHELAPLSSACRPQVPWTASTLRPPVWEPFGDRSSGPTGASFHRSRCRRRPRWTRCAHLPDGLVQYAAVGGLLGFAAVVVPERK